MSREGQCDQLFWRGGNFLCGLGKVNRDKLRNNVFGKTSIIEPFGHPIGISCSTGEIDRGPLINSLFIFHRFAKMKLSFTNLHVNSRSRSRCTSGGILTTNFPLKELRESGC